MKAKRASPACQARAENAVIRVWVAGCSTGEEAYSLAILLKEYLQETGKENDYTIQIYATDIDTTAIEKARQGLYPPSIRDALTPERLRKFFVKEESRYRVKKEIREMIVFAPQNVISDPPFTRLDILSCRNLLIYLTHEIQKKIIPLFHYALDPSAILFLGSSESIGSLSDLFIPVDNKWKIFLRQNSTHAAVKRVEIPVLAGPPRQHKTSHRSRNVPGDRLSRLVTEKLIEEFVPPAVFINELGDILHVSGRTGNYLEPAAGAPNMNAFAMAREGLRFELASTVRKAISRKEEVIVRALKVRINRANDELTSANNDFVLFPHNSGLKRVKALTMPCGPLSTKR